MKRLLLLLVLMFGLSFACDRPNEEISGVKIGCSVQKLENLEDFQRKPYIFGEVLVYEDDDRFFNKIVLIDLDGYVEGGVFISQGNNINDTSFNLYLASLKEKWGDVDLVDRNIAVFEHTDNAVISQVILMMSLENDSMYMIYNSKKLTSFLEVQESIEARVFINDLQKM